MVSLNIKDGVEFKIDSFALGRMLATLLTLPYNGPIVITAGSDGQHQPNSRHYKGEAIDIRIWNLPNVEEFRALFAKALGPKFTVLLEGDHIHCQVKKGGHYP